MFCGLDAEVVKLKKGLNINPSRKTYTKPSTWGELYSILAGFDNSTSSV